MMASVWALMGNYEVPSMATPGHDVTMMTLEQARNYADDALQLTTKSKVPPEQQLAWLKKQRRDDTHRDDVIDAPEMADI